MKSVDKIALWALISAAAWAFFAVRLDSALWAGVPAIAFAYCLRRACAAISNGPRAKRGRERRRDQRDGERYVRAISIEDETVARAAISDVLRREYGLSSPVPHDGGFLFDKGGERVYIAMVVRHPEAPKIGAQELIAAYRAMRAAKAGKAVLAATCAAGKLPAEEPLSSIRVIDAARLAGIFAKHPEAIDRSLFPEKQKSARGKKLRALCKAVSAPPTLRQCALHAGYAVLLLCAYWASRSPVALICFALQLARIAYGLLSRGKTVPPNLL